MKKVDSFARVGVIWSWYLSDSLFELFCIAKYSRACCITLLSDVASPIEKHKTEKVVHNIRSYCTLESGNWKYRRPCGVKRKKLW